MLKHRWSLVVALGLLSIIVGVGIWPQGFLALHMERGHTDTKVTQRNLLYMPEARAVFQAAELPVGPHELLKLGEAQGIAAVDEELLAHAERLRREGRLTEATYSAVNNVAYFFCSLWSRDIGSKFPYRMQVIAAQVLDPQRVMNGSLQPWQLGKVHLTLPNYGIGWGPFVLFFVLLIPKFMALRLGWWMISFAYFGRNGVHQGDIITEVRIGWRSILAQVANIFAPLPNGAFTIHGEVRYAGEGWYTHWVRQGIEALAAGEPVPAELHFSKAPIADYQNFGFLARLLAHFITERIEKVGEGSQRLAAILNGIVRDNGRERGRRQVTPLTVLHGVVNEIFANPLSLRHANMRFALLTASYAASMLFFANLVTHGAKEAHAADSVFLQYAAAGRPSENLFVQLEHDGVIPWAEQPYSLYLDHVVGTQALALEGGLTFANALGVEKLFLAPTGVAAFDFSDGPNLTALKAGGKVGYALGDTTIFLPGFWNFTQNPKKPDFLFANPRVVYEVVRFGEGDRFGLGAMAEGIGTVNVDGVVHASGGPGPFLSFPGGHLRGSVQVPFGADAGQGVSGLISASIPLFN